MPVAGKLIATRYIPGDLFSVNQTTAENIENADESLIAGIETPWAGEVAPVKRRVITQDFTELTEIDLAKGDEMGRFKLGSTVVLLFGPDMIDWQADLEAQSPLQMGQTIASARV